jgi:CheY-like chemotaxis protein/predicted ester cyclase
MDASPTALPRVLVVDDEDSIRRFAARVLEPEGYVVVTAPDGREALALIEREPFDLFVLDLMMPQMNGVELARELRRISPDARVLYLTGYGSRLFEERPALAPNEAFLDKPTNPEGLREAVSLMLFGHLHGIPGRDNTLPVRYTPDAATDRLLHQYYRCLNERRFRDAAPLIVPDAVLELIPVAPGSRGIEAYVRFAESWTGAFPDATFTVEHVELRRPGMLDVRLRTTGTHVGVFDLGSFQFKPSNSHATFCVRELLTIHQGRIAASTLSIDMQDVIRQLSKVDYRELGSQLERVRLLTEEFLHASGDEARQREIADRLGPELDATRRTLRPHYNRIGPQRPS